MNEYDGTKAKQTAILTLRNIIDHLESDAIMISQFHVEESFDGQNLPYPMSKRVEVAYTFRPLRSKE